MSWISSFFNNPIGTLSNTGQSIISSLNSTVDKIIRDPIPMIVAAVGSHYNIPVYVSAAAVVASRGGDVEDMARAAALSYATANALKGTPIPDVTKQIGEYVGSATTAGVGNAVAAGLNTSVVAGVRAAVTGKSVSDAMAAGFTTGAVGSGVSSALTSLNSDQGWGLTKDQLAKISGVTSVGVSGALTGKDPAALIGNYIANAVLNVGKSEAGSAIKKSLADTQNTYDKKYAEATAAQKEFDTATGIATYLDNLHTTDINHYNKVQIPAIEKAYALYQAGDYNGMKNTLEDVGQSEEVRLRPKPTVSWTQEQAASTLQSFIDKSVNGVQKAVTYLKAPEESNYWLSNATQKHDAYLAKLDEFLPVRDQYTSLDKQYQQLVADTATKGFLENYLEYSIKSGDIKQVENPNGEEGFTYFDNGMAVDRNGKIYQGDSQLFTNAVSDPEADPQDTNKFLQSLGIDTTTPVPETEAASTMVRGVFKVDENGNYYEAIPDGKGGWIPTGNVHIFANRTPKDGEYTGKDYAIDYDAKDVAATLEPVTIPPIDDGKVKPVSSVDNPDGTVTQTMSDGTTRVVDMDGNPVKTTGSGNDTDFIDPLEDIDGGTSGGAGGAGSGAGAGSSSGTTGGGVSGGTDTATGVDGEDTLTGGGDDTVSGGGDDTVTGGGGTDVTPPS